ncbi:hypothetical protein DE146DRAFT_679943 [Phaeosphaeria sp. MPI-PUGE-AT-0046c]|nr:hypothetical protein DE146DRAFT_679943 [Phaeosphaeria sp. MPI-PUGE-AT-0046c]
MAALVEPGFAIRRLTSCLSGLEVDCGSTGIDGFRGCCPSSLICDPKAPNRICCPPGDDSCTESALAAKSQPPCANGTWDLFNNGGYYCCEHGVQAYDRGGTNWCGKPRQSSSIRVATLSVLREGIASSSASPDASQSSLMSASASPPPPSSQSSSPPVGAIAGGVVGGIAALSLVIFLTWFFLRRRRQTHTPELHSNTHAVHEKYALTSASGGAIYEVGEHHSRMPVTEMAGNTRPVELDGMGAVR